MKYLNNTRKNERKAGLKKMKKIIFTSTLILLISGVALAQENDPDSREDGNVEVEKEDDSPRIIYHQSDEPEDRWRRKRRLLSLTRLRACRQWQRYALPSQSRASFLPLPPLKAARGLKKQLVGDL